MQGSPFCKPPSLAPLSRPYSLSPYSLGLRDSGTMMLWPGAAPGKRTMTGPTSIHGRLLTGWALGLP